MAISLGVSSYVTSGLVFHVDAGNTTSYPGTGTTWTDIAGSTAGVMTGVTYSSAINGGTMVFNGVTGIGVTYPGTNLSLNTLTISVWCYATNYIQSGFLFEKTTNNVVNTQYSLFFGGDGNLYFRTYGLSTQDLAVPNFGANIENSQWNNIVATFDGTYKRIYVNHALVATSAALTGTITANSVGNAYIGSYGLLASYPYNGYISSVQVYNRALSISEMQQNSAYFNKGIYLNDGTSLTTSSSTATDTGRLLAVSSYITNSSTFNWTPYVPTTTPATVTWTYSGTATVAATGTTPGPYTLTHSAAPSTWTQSAVSTESGVNVFAQATPNQTNCYIMFGLTRTPGPSYTNIEYAIYYEGSTGQIYIYESGSPVGSQYGAYTTTTIGRVTYDGSYIRYYADVNGTRPIRVVAVSGLTGLKFQAAFYNGGSLSNVYFGPTTHQVAKKAFVMVTGGGGGAAGYSESGGAGGHAEKMLDVTGVQTVTVTIGGGGTTVTYYAVAGNGGTSSFGSYVTATGGNGGNANVQHTGGSGGTGSGGDVNVVGGAGTGHSNLAGSGAIGNGGPSYWGSGYAISHSQNTPVGFTAPGAGGAGGRTDAVSPGSVGAPGAVVVYSYS